MAAPCDIRKYRELYIIKPLLAVFLKGNYNGYSLPILT